MTKPRDPLVAQTSHSGLAADEEDLAPRGSLHLGQALAERQECIGALEQLAKGCRSRERERAVARLPMMNLPGPHFNLRAPAGPQTPRPPAEHDADRPAADDQRDVEHSPWVVIVFTTGAVVCFENRQHAAGTRRVHQGEHVRSHAGADGTRLLADLQDKRARE